MAARSSDDKPAKDKDRQDRLAAALRQNLRRRKAQQKGRRDSAEAPPKGREDQE